MATTVSLATLRSDVRLRADVVNSQRVSDEEIDRYINLEVAEFYDLLIDSNQDYALNSSTFATVNGTDSYALPANFYRVRGVDVNIGGQQLLTAHMFNFEERNRYKLIGVGWFLDQPVWYDLQGSNLKFIPAPQGSYTVTLWYYPPAPVLSADTDTIDVVNNWVEGIVCGAAVRVALREESYELAQALGTIKEAQRQRILKLAAKRAHAEPDRVTDMRPYMFLRRRYPI